MVLVQCKFKDVSQSFELQAPPKFTDLLSEVAELHSLRDYKITYETDQGKRKAIVSDTDLKSAVESSPRQLNVFVEPSSSTAPVEETARSVPESDVGIKSLAAEDRSHYTNCDGCSKNWILDVRYQCASSAGYNLCYCCMGNHTINKGEYSFWMIEYPTAARFDVHMAKCNACNVKTIVGARYLCTNQPWYSLCESCMANGNVDKYGCTFRLVKYPWQVDPNRRKVPYPVIQYGSQGIEVMMLQKILTDLGYMTPYMYDQLVGTYGSNTYYAVIDFRRAYGLPGYDYYDEAMAACLERVIKREVRRVNPSVEKDFKPPQA